MTKTNLKWKTLPCGRAWHAIASDRWAGVSRRYTIEEKFSGFVVTEHTGIGANHIRHYVGTASTLSGAKGAAETDLI